MKRHVVANPLCQTVELVVGDEYLGGKCIWWDHWFTKTTWYKTQRDTGNHRCRTRPKVVDVLLLLGRKQQSYVQGHLYCLHYTLCLRR
jgi:hypothetical protein